ncbi:MAG: TetR/AcrR family transcriptional regulator [Planctomycetes bacterium]|nr:TetR/AcrR family transcriptional regulator [Planctomycetota bacterium]
MPAKDRRRQLLKIAADLFARRGYRGATTAELARLAGITQPILYHHFEHKLDLFISVIDDAGKQIISSWRNALEGIDDPQSRLSALLAGNPATGQPGRGPCRVILCAMAEARYNPAIRAAVRTHLITLHDFLTDELVQLQSSGAMRGDQPANALAWFVIQQALGSDVLSPLGAAKPSRAHDKPDIQRLLEELLSPC